MTFSLNGEHSMIHKLPEVVLEDEAFGEHGQSDLSSFTTEEEEAAELGITENLGPSQNSGKAVPSPPQTYADGLSPGNGQNMTFSLDEDYSMLLEVLEFLLKDEAFGEHEESVLSSFTTEEEEAAEMGISENPEPSQNSGKAVPSPPQTYADSLPPCNGQNMTFSLDEDYSIIFEALEFLLKDEAFGEHEESALSAFITEEEEDTELGITENRGPSQNSGKAVPSSPQTYTDTLSPCNGQKMIVSLDEDYSMILEAIEFLIKDEAFGEHKEGALSSFTTEEEEVAELGITENPGPSQNSGKAIPSPPQTYADGLSPGNGQDMTFSLDEDYCMILEELEISLKDENFGEHEEFASDPGPSNPGTSQNSYGQNLLSILYGELSMIPELPELVLEDADFE